jgi:hypothetical protein
MPRGIASRGIRDEQKHPSGGESMSPAVLGNADKRGHLGSPTQDMMGVVSLALLTISRSVINALA